MNVFVKRSVHAVRLNGIIRCCHAWSSGRPFMPQFESHSDSDSTPIGQRPAPVRGAAMLSIPTCLVAAWLMLAGSAPADLLQNSSDPAQLTTLVTKLRAASFRERLQAESDCRQSGAAVLPALLEALHSPDPELRRRAQMLIEQIEEDDLADSIEAFISPGSTSTLPGWTFVSEWVEDTPAFRVAYADMIRNDPQLGRALSRPDRLADELKRQVRQAGSANGIFTPVPSPVRSSAILLLLVHPEATHTEEFATSAYQSLNQGLNHQNRTTAAGQLHQALFTRWVITPHRGQSFNRFHLAFRSKLPEAVIPAVELVQQRANSPRLNEPLLAIARYGGPEEMAIVETLLTDTTELDSHAEAITAKKETTQLRDLALATLIEMNKQDPVLFGLKPFSRDNAGYIQVITPSFESDAQRDDAFGKWKEWSAKHLKKFRALPQNAAEGLSL